MIDPLGDRMKSQYENRTRYFLPRRTYTILRVDFKAFHTFVSVNKCEKPFDTRLSDIFDKTTRMLVDQMQGSKLAYTQSDEISVLLTDFDTNKTDAWFDNNLQKLCSVTASICTEEFARNNNVFKYGRALCDCRAFTIPDPIEVANYFIWRQKDCTRNAISTIAQSLYSHKELEGKSSQERIVMIEDKIKCRIDSAYSARYLLGYTDAFTLVSHPFVDFSSDNHRPIYELIPVHGGKSVQQLIDQGAL